MGLSHDRVVVRVPAARLHEHLNLGKISVPVKFRLRLVVDFVAALKHKAQQ